MTRAPSRSEVIAAYGSRATEYVDLYGSEEATHLADRRLIYRWARRLDGPVLDVGCGPGQWTAFLAGRGVRVEGIDPVPEFVAAAQRAYPGLSFRAGDADDLGVPPDHLGGVLAWYSLIHLSESEMDAALEVFHRALRDDGSLVIGFFAGEDFETFPHAIVPAHYWPVEKLSLALQATGFEVVASETREDAGARRHGAIVARRLQHPGESVG